MSWRCHWIVNKVLTTVAWCMLVLHLRLLILSVFHKILIHCPVIRNLRLLVTRFRSRLTLTWSSISFHILGTTWDKISSLSTCILIVTYFSHITTISSLMLLSVHALSRTIWILRQPIWDVIICSIKKHTCTLLMSMTTTSSILRRRLLNLPTFNIIDNIFDIFLVNSITFDIMRARVHTTIQVQLLWIIHFYELFNLKMP